MTEFDFDPDSLFEELANTPEIGNSSGGEKRSYYKIPLYVGVVQGMSAMYKKDYDFAIGTRATGSFEGVYANEVRMLLIEELSNYDPAAKVYAGGRLMYAYNDDGTKKQDGDSSCESENGFFPRVQNFGKHITHPVTGKVVQIGYKDGEALPVEQLARTCLSCPLAQGATVNGRYRPSPCQERTTWVIYLLAQTFYRPTEKLVRGKMQYEAVEFAGGLARISGSSLGVLLALKGRDPKRAKSGLTSDGKGFTGIVSAFRATSKEVLSSVPLSVMSPSALNMRGFMGYGTHENNSIGKERLEKHTHAWFSVKAEPFAPQGRPELMGDRSFGAVPVYSVLMYAVENDFGKNPNVANVKCPQFAVLDGTTLELPAEIVPPDEYKRYVGEKTQFRLDGRKAEMMGLQPRDEERLHRLPAPKDGLQISSGVPQDAPDETPARETGVSLDEIPW